MSRRLQRTLARLCGVFAVWLCLSITGGQGALAGASIAPLPIPQGPIVLSIRGKIQNTNTYGQADLDMAMLQSLPTTRIVTSTPWTQGIITFEGVSIQTLMKPSPQRAIKVSSRRSTIIRCALVLMTPLNTAPLWLICSTASP
ncbi:MAG: hypothetical protein JKY27_10595 [Magnetovibrio sp.]|nr:hypothetical protein [Magnetovibrio sp.]